MLTEGSVHPTLPASDLERARRFYEGVLGFTPVSFRAGAVSYALPGGSTFVVFESSGTASGTHTQAGFSVSDVEAEVSALKGRGVVFETYDMPGFDASSSIMTSEEIKGAWFRDPEGNLLGIMQYLDKA